MNEYLNHLMKRLSRRISSLFDEELPRRRFSVQSLGFIQDIEKQASNYKREELIEDHKEKIAEIARMKEKTSVMLELIDQLAVKYKNTNQSSIFSFCNQEATYKAMIDEALQEYALKILHTQFSRSSFQRLLLKGFHVVYLESQERAKLSPVFTAVQDVIDFFDIAAGPLSETSSDSLLYITREYSSMSSKQLIHDLVLLHGKMATCSIMLRQKELTFTKLRIDYDNLYFYNSKLWYCQRVKALKKMIEMATLDVTVEKF